MSNIYKLALQERDLFIAKHKRNDIKGLTSPNMIQVYNDNNFQKIKYGKFVIITASKDNNQKI